MSGLSFHSQLHTCGGVAWQACDDIRISCWPGSFPYPSHIHAAKDQWHWALKFRDEPINWTKWCVREGWNDRTVKRYIGVYEECLRHPRSSIGPLPSFSILTNVTKDDYLNDPIQIGCVLHVHYVAFRRQGVRV